MTSLPSEWQLGAVSVIAVSPRDAANLSGAQEQAEKLYEALFEQAGRPVARAKTAAARAFVEPQDPAQAAMPSRTVLAYIDGKSDRIAAFTRVYYDGERILLSLVAMDTELPEEEQQEVSRAVVTATEDLSLEMARGVLQASDEKEQAHSLMAWRGQLGASEFLKKLYQEAGFEESRTDRLEMTVYSKDVDMAAGPVTGEVPEGFEIRALDLEQDDLVKVYDVLKIAFGNAPPSFEAWKRHYAQAPRFASDLSFVMWHDEQPVSVAFIELMVDGEGGGEEEVERIYATDVELVQTTEPFPTTLQFAEDYEERKNKIRAVGKVGYVCGVATLPSYRGKKLAQSVLRHTFRACALAGLESVYLGTDRQNPAAVRAYTRAGMVETKAENNGMITAKEFALQP